ncbi:MAG: hypothetical protein R3E10_01335 [Gemmatimonadota bacterium]
MSHEHDPGDERPREEDMEMLLAEARRSYNPAPPVPREEMWANIAEQLPETRQRRGRHWPRWSPLVLRAAAAGVVLAIGVGLGRWSAVRTILPERESSVAGRALATAGAAPDQALRFAAFEHLSQTQRFLSEIDTLQAPTAVLGAWGRRLLTDTRLLLDTQASQDPELRTILEDLELILVQVVQLTQDRAEDAEKVEIETLRNGLREQQVLPRIQRMLPPVIGADD